jgi:DsbC/DsbD-like thiol-disulfide interchange protein
MCRIRFVIVQFNWLLAGAFSFVLLFLSVTETMSSDWTEREFARFRLLSASNAIDPLDRVLVALEVELKPGWQFYHPNPGKFGVAPKFDWSGSQNLKKATLHWPPPTQFSYSLNPPVTTTGYKGSLLLPMTLTVEEKNDECEIWLQVEYAVCKEFCVTDDIRLSLFLPPDAAIVNEQAERIRRALELATRSKALN